MLEITQKSIRFENGITISIENEIDQFVNDGSVLVASLLSNAGIRGSNDVRAFDLTTGEVLWGLAPTAYSVEAVVNRNPIRGLLLVAIKANHLGVYIMPDIGDASVFDLRTGAFVEWRPNR